MAIHRLNHAVLYVSDLARSVAFYRDVLGFRPVAMTPTASGAPRSSRRPDSTNDHDLGLFEIGAAAGPSRPAGDRRPLPPRLGGRHPRRAGRGRRRLAAAGALAGASDHGTTKSLYGKDPDGLEFEVVWLVPADLLDAAALAARKRIGRLDLAARRQRYGGQTRGGVGISVPA